LLCTPFEVRPNISYTLTRRSKNVRITSKGQVTIPLAIREKLGLLPNTEVEFDITGNTVRIRKLRGRTRRGEALVARMRGKGSVRMTTEQILALTRDDR
jgi:AbrB family looped-hinge helix DNA binding protein